MMEIAYGHHNIALHIDNKERADKSVSKKLRTTFLSQYISIDDYSNEPQHDDDL